MLLAVVHLVSSARSLWPFPTWHPPAIPLGHSLLFLPALGSPLPLFLLALAEEGHQAAQVWPLLGRCCAEVSTTIPQDWNSSHAPSQLFRGNCDSQATDIYPWVMGSRVEVWGWEWIETKKRFRGRRGSWAELDALCSFCTEGQPMEKKSCGHNRLQVRSCVLEGNKIHFMRS